MKRKIFSVFFALVLAFSLVGFVAPAVPAAAQTTLEVTLVATHAGIAEWSCAQQHSGSSSVKMKAPGKCDWGDWAGTYADALIQIPLEGTTLEGLTLNEIVDMSWWNYLVSGYPPALRIKLDYDGDGSSDYHLVGEFAYQEWLEGHGYVYIGDWDPYTHYKGGLEATNTFYYPTYDTWMQTFHTTDNVSAARPDDTVTTTVHSDTIFWTMVVGGAYGTDWCSAPYSTGVGAASYFATLDDYKTTEVSNMGNTNTLPILGDAEVLMLEFAITNEIGLTGDPAGHEVYFDDITINTVTYELELPAARPLTVDDDRAQLSTAYFQTIQGAIDCAIAGDTINVYPGTYAEALSIDKEVTLTGVTALGADNWTALTAGAGATAPTITYDGSHGHMIAIDADNVIFQGFNIDMTDTSATRAIHFRSAGQALTDNTRIQYNTFTGACRAINVSDDRTVTDLTVTYNKFTGDGTDWGNWLAIDSDAGISAVTQTSNVFSYNIVTGLMTGRLQLGTRNMEDITWSNNSFSYGFTLTELGEGAGEYGDLVVTNNTFVGAPSTAAFEVDATVENADWEGGTCTTDDVTINYNDFSGYASDVPKTIYITNPPTNPLNAEYNWWGNVAGPITDPVTNPYNTAATAQANADVGPNVDYIPWLIQVDLVEGWNIVSWPILCDWGEEEEPPEWMGPLYYFNSSTQYWGTPADWSGYTELDAMYIKIDLTGLEITAPITISACISSDATFPSQKAMKVGWNLIGLADLHHGMGLEAALFDAYWGTGEAELVGYSKVISPSLNGVSWTHVRDGQPHPLLTTKGYWVFMVNDGVLGGFTSTPIVEEEPQ